MTAARPTTDEVRYDLILQTAAVLHSNGQSTSMTLVAVDRLNKGLGTDAALIPTWSTVTLRATRSRIPARVITAPPTGMNMRRVGALMRTVDDVETGKAGVRELSAALTESERISVPPTLLFAAACAGAAGGLSLVYGASHWSVVAVVAVVAGAGGVVRRALQRFHIGVLGQSFVAALLAGAVGAVATDLDPSGGFGVVTICPAMILVPGPHILMGAMDLLALRVPLGAARLCYAMLVLTAIASGIVVGLGIGGQTLQLAAPTTHDGLSADVLGATVAAACFPVFYAMPYRFAVWPVAIGASAHALHWWALNDAHAGLAAAALLSCAYTGSVLGTVAYFHRFPFAAVGFAAVVALLPGVYVFRALAGLVRLPTAATPTLIADIASDCATAILVVVCMAVGLTVPTRIRDALIQRREQRGRGPGEITGSPRARECDARDEYTAENTE